MRSGHGSAAFPGDAAARSAPAQDGLDRARALTRWALALGAAGAIVAFGGEALPRLRATIAPDPRPALQRARAGERLAIEPAGRVGRAPASHPAIAPHFVPGLSALAPDVDRLLVTP